MDDIKLEKLLREIGKENPAPSEKLVEAVKLMVPELKRSLALRYLIAASMLVNAVVSFCFIYFMFFTYAGSIDFIVKCSVYIAVSSVMNIILLGVYSCREKIKDLLYNSLNEI